MTKICQCCGQPIPIVEKYGDEVSTFTMGFPQYSPQYKEWLKEGVKRQMQELKRDLQVWEKGLVRRD